MNKRASFCYGDSHTAPVCRGTSNAWEDVLCELLNESFCRGSALGAEQLRPPALVERVLQILNGPLDQNWSFSAGRNLDHYIEAQIHGPVLLGRDVEALVADPAFRHTAIGEQIEALSVKLIAN